MSAARKDRSPWPMRWIVLAIVLFVPVYTWLTLHYRRPGPAFRPYQDMRDRADVVRLLKAGYKGVAIDARRPGSRQPASGAEKDARRVPSPSPRDRLRVGGPGRRLGDRLSDRAHLHAARQQAAAVGGPPLRAGGRDCHRS